MQRRDVRRVFRHVEGDAHMGLGPQVINLVRPDLGQKPGEHGAVRQVAVVEEEPPPGVVGILIE